MSEWLELELADRLAPVRAPERLWYLVRSAAPIPSRRRRPLRTALLVAAAAAASVWVAAAWRPEARSVRAIGLTAAAESPTSCRSCHMD